MIIICGNNLLGWIRQDCWFGKNKKKSDESYYSQFLRLNLLISRLKQRSFRSDIGVAFKWECFNMNSMYSYDMFKLRWIINDTLLMFFFTFHRQKKNIIYFHHNEMFKKKLKNINLLTHLTFTNVWLDTPFIIWWRRCSIFQTCFTSPIPYSIKFLIFFSIWLTNSVQYYCVVSLMGTHLHKLLMQIY